MVSLAVECQVWFEEDFGGDVSYPWTLLGTPAQIARPPDDPAILTADDGRQRRKSTPGDQSMRRTIQDLIASVDPNVKIDPEVEDVSPCFFSCRLDLIKV